jgi:uncharacterized phosphosugar-binding protein
MQTAFYDKVEEILKKIRNTQSETIEKVAEELTEILDKGGIIYTFGTGHSHLLAEEIFARAGGMFQVKGLLEPEFMLHEERGKSTLYERLPGLAKAILEVNNVRSLDAIIIISNSGRNSVPVEMAIEAKKMGMLVIALTNVEHSKSVSSRDKSGKRLFEAADYVLDNCGIPGDAVLDVKGKPYKVAPTSTIAGAIILEALIAQVTQKLIDKGKEAYVMMSANLDGSDNYNKEQRIKILERFPDLLFLLK